MLRVSVKSDPLSRRIICFMFSSYVTWPLNPLDPDPYRGLTGPVATIVLGPATSNETTTVETATVVQLNNFCRDIQPSEAFNIIWSSYKSCRYGFTGFSNNTAILCIFTMTFFFTPSMSYGLFSAAMLLFITMEANAHVAAWHPGTY